MLNPGIGGILFLGCVLRATDVKVNIYEGITHFNYYNSVYKYSHVSQVFKLM